jgi:hypothetical protein
MPHWGYILLSIDIALGLSSITWRKAGTLAAVLAVGIVAYTFVSYGALK